MIWLLAILLLTGCGFNESPHPCKRNSDCAGSRQCVFAVDDGCGGAGHCDEAVMRFGPPPTTCEPKTGVACGCDGGPGYPIGCGWDTPVMAEGPCR